MYCSAHRGPFSTVQALVASVFFAESCRPRAVPAGSPCPSVFSGLPTSPFVPQPFGYTLTTCRSKLSILRLPARLPCASLPPAARSSLFQPCAPARPAVAAPAHSPVASLLPSPPPQGPLPAAFALPSPLPSSRIVPQAFPGMAPEPARSLL